MAIPWGIAPICWAIWKNRNKACFEKKAIKNPLEIMCHACALMNFLDRPIHRHRQGTAGGRRGYDADSREGDLSCSAREQCGRTDAGLWRSTG